jgi:hypothetical protein
VTVRRRHLTITVAALAGALACDAPVGRRRAAAAAGPDERPTRVELVVADDSAPASAPAPLSDSALAERASWPTTVIRFQGTEGTPITMWAGDTLRLAPPEPPAGTPPDIARDLRWSSREPTVAAVSPGGLVTANRPGTATIVAWRRVGMLTVPLTVLPAARGRVLLADAGPDGLRPDDPPSVAFAVRTDAGWQDSVRIDAAGRYVWRPEKHVGRAAQIIVVPLDETAHQYFSTVVGRVLAEDMVNMSFVLIPRRWRIDAGSYAGTTVDIDPAAALARLRDGSRFWRLARANRAGGPGRPVGWPTRRFPIPVAFRTDGEGDVRRADSVAFWGAARQLERDWGAPLFVPASGDDSYRPDWLGITVQIDARIPADGFTTTTSTGDGDVTEADVAFRSRALLRNAGIVTHELMHALGLGHTDRQESVMRSGGSLPTRVSADDVAYGRLLYAVRALQARWHAEFGLGEVYPQ